MIGKTVEFIVNRKVVTGIIKDKIQLWEEIRIGAPATIDYYLVEVDGLLTLILPAHANRIIENMEMKHNG